MNYQSHYDALIRRAEGRSIAGPTESHHIVPRCMGGGDGKSNRVRLTPEEHYVAHQLLVRIHPEIHGLAIAAVCMARDNRNGKRSNNKLYGWLRKRAAAAQSINLTGRTVSDETRRRISESSRTSAARMEHVDSLRGVERTTEVRAKISESHKTSSRAAEARQKLNNAKIGVPRSAETRAKIGLACIGKTLGNEQRAKISTSLAGKPKAPAHIANVARGLAGNQNARGAVRSDETRAKMSAAMTGRKRSPEAIRKAVESKTPEQRRAAALKAWETKRAKVAAA